MTESPFKRIKKNKNDIELLPKSGKYEDVYIFMHGLLTSPSKYVDFFDTADSPIPSNFKVVMPCAPVQNADFNFGVKNSKINFKLSSPTPLEKIVSNKLFVYLTKSSSKLT